MKSTSPNQDPNEKDYFQVTDELAKENSHFALSEALLAVVEQVSSHTLYTAILLDNEPSIASDLYVKNAAMQTL